MAAHAQRAWQSGRVEAVRDIAEGIREITLAPARPRPAAPGAHIDVVVPGGEPTLMRSYSVVCAPQDGRQLTIAVNLAPRSQGGSRYMHGLRVGDELTMTQPLQNFPLHVGADRYLLIAGGVGITALAEMATVLARLGADYRLIYVGRRRERMAYLATLAAAHGERLITHIDSKANPLRVDALIDAEAARGPLELYMCGPIRLMDAIRRRWQYHGLAAADLRYETFGNSGWFEAERFTVRVPRLGIEAVVGPDASLLETLERAGAGVLSDCRKGECGICQVKVLEVAGHIDHRDVFFSDTQKAAGAKMCVCVSRVAGGGTPPMLSLDIP